MRVTSKAHYALRALLDLALYEQSRGPVNLSDIAARQDISLSYLEQLFSRLRKQGLVVSSRGPGGGYRLGRTADRISVAQVTAAVSENIDTTKCGGTSDCQQGSTCLTHHLWMDLNKHIQDFLEDVSLADLLARRETDEQEEAHQLNIRPAAERAAGDVERKR